MTYVVVVNHKSHEAMLDLVAVLIKQFPKERFSIHGTEEKVYKLHIEGVGDEREPRKVAEKFFKTWKPKPTDVN